MTETYRGTDRAGKRERERESSHTAVRQFMLMAAILAWSAKVMPRCLPSFPSDGAEQQ